MIQLFLNGKLVDYGTKKDVSFYVKLGYDVKVLNAEEAENYRYMMKIKGVWKTLPMVLRKRVHFLLNNRKLTWVDRYNTMIRILQTIMRRVKGFNVVSAFNRKKQSFIDKLMAILSELMNFMTPQSPAQYALARA
jgi:hypothetical protein